VDTGEPLIGASVRRFALAAAIVSVYNLIIWSLDWLRQDAVYIGPALWALIPQIAATLALFGLIRTKHFFRRSIILVICFFMTWIAAIVIGSTDLFFPDEPLPWSFSFSFLEALGFPILELNYEGVAPWLGLLHSNMGDLNKLSDWYFDGGIQLSWLLFNLLALLIVSSISKTIYQERYDLSRYWNQERNDGRVQS
jgi:hypothetical protein